MTDYLDPQVRPETHKAPSERQQYSQIPFKRECKHCGLQKRVHINELFCPEWRLRQLDGDR